VLYTHASKDSHKTMCLIWTTLGSIVVWVNCIFFDSFLNALRILIVMEGRIHSFKRGRTTQTTNQMIIVVKGLDKREKAAELVGKKVVWKSPADRETNGEVRSAHGNSGALRVLFEKGMPGQAIGDKVEIN